ncbi:MAG: ParB/RepB/Spo0J family partition protein [Gemmatimonadota bacterium]|nr:ParB/RepB/Spo0J family partition protein [Gemmatimonadota bacterium]
MSAEKTPRRLGRGLDALLGERTSNRPQAPGTSGMQPHGQPNTQQHTQQQSQQGTAAEPSSALRDIPLANIRPNHYQPRKEFSDDNLKELADSIRSAGLLQPIAVRAVGDRYELVAGERRFRAVKSLGWASIPAIVHDYDDQTMLTLALIENLQRADLNPIEEGEGYARLASEFGLTQNEIASLVGKDRSTIANLQRVLQLPPAVRKLLETGALSLGHARPLLSLEDDALAISLATEAVEHGLSVRAIEERVRHEAPHHEKARRGRPRKEDNRPAEVRHVEDLLRKRFQTDVSVVQKRGDRGELRIRFYSTEDLNRLLETMGAME